MKAIFVLAALIVAVSCETCRDHDECSITTCGTGAELHCISRQCTCTTAAGGDGVCATATECHGRCDHGRQHHCIDGRCRCTHF
ncbi:serine protease inhibitor Cvsi-2-like [Ostrea edulis]|uniref:serine protease inhibitor Cvsi-2-like n=1 Tax=Ostrea edulis TaxID=37623 RepID=UPI0024AED5F4|nr:serine protease inhibitor Cvsi-2-like [Ostrea edulis]